MSRFSIEIEGSVQEQTDHLVAVLDLLDQRGAEFRYTTYNHRIATIIKRQYPRWWGGWISNAKQKRRVIDLNP